jgi:hypothetical protein
MSPAAAVHDGNTVFTRALANVSVRFLGVDTPEVAFALPGQNNPTPISNPKWEAFLANPFADWPDAKEALGEDLHAFLAERTGAGTAANHAEYAEAAEKALEQMVAADVATFAAGWSISAASQTETATGDIAGVRSRLFYLAQLGVDAIWINPWYRSPMADAG